MSLAWLFSFWTVAFIFLIRYLLQGRIENIHQVLYFIDAPAEPVTHGDDRYILINEPDETGIVPVPPAIVIDHLFPVGINIHPPS